MYQDIETLLKLTNTYGLSLLITIIVLYFLVKWIHSKLFPPKHQDTPEKFAIQSHSIFSTMDYIVQIGIKRLFFRNRFKQVLFSDLLETIFTVMHQHIQEMVEMEQLSSISRDAFEHKITRAFTDMILTTEQAIHKELTPHFSHIPEGIEPAQLVIEKYNQTFEHQSYLLFQAIREICHSAFFKTNEQRLSGILYVMKMMMMMIMLEAEQVFCAMNGDFNGWTYKGITYQQ